MEFKEDGLLKLWLKLGPWRNFPIFQVSFYSYGEIGTGTPNGGMLGRMLKIMTNSRTNSPQIRFRQSPQLFIFKFLNINCCYR